MHFTFVTAAVIIALLRVSPALGRQPAATRQTARPARRALAEKGLGIVNTGQLPDIADNSIPTALGASDYRWNEGIVPGGGQLPPDNGDTSGLSGAFAGPGLRHGLTLRLHGMRLTKNYWSGDGSDLGPPQFASRKHLFLTISKQF